MHRSVLAAAAAASLLLPLAAASATPLEGSTTANAGLANLDDFSGDERYAAFYNQEINWSEDCTKATTYPREGRTYQCATLKAPVDWYNPEKGTIDVGIGRVVEYGDWSENNDRRLLLTNPGGPGGEGLNIGAVLNQYIGAGETHNGVGIDPRGVGSSTNLMCPADEEPAADGVWADGDSRTFDRAKVKASADQFARELKACADDQAGLVEYINTDQTARDFNMVRVVLGYDAADLYGISYGTWLFGHMEKMFPNSFDRVILDGNLDWSGPTITEAWVAQAQGFQSSFDRVLLPFLGRHNDVYGLGEGANAVLATHEKLRREVKKGTFGDDITAQNFDTTTARSLYGQWKFHSIGLLHKDMLAVVNGDASKLEGVRAQLVDNEPKDAGSSVFQVLPCADNEVERDRDAQYDRNAANAKNLPMLGTDFAITYCDGWPHKPAFGKEILDRPVGNVLMVHNEADPATAWRGAVDALRNAKGNVKMLAIDDLGGHGLPGLDSQCAADKIANYLVKGNFPAANEFCQAGPITSGPVTDEKVYEFGKPASDARPVPRTYGYIMRVLQEPRVDEAATAAFSGENRIGDPISERSDLDRSEITNAIADAYISTLR